MEFYYYILIAVVIGLTYLVISRNIKHRRTTKKLPNIIFKLMAIKWPEESREGLILNAFNAERKKIGVKPLKAGAGISKEAKGRAIIQDKTNKITHAGIGKSFIRLKKRGSDGSSDIISYALQFPVGRKTTYVLGRRPPKKRKGYGWMNSKSHRETILDPKYDYVGIGCVLDEHNHWIDDAIFVDEKTVK